MIKKIFFSIILFCAVIVNAANGDYRTKASGNWKSTAVWEYDNGSGFAASATYPGQNPKVGSGIVTIRNTFAVTFTATVANSIGSLVTQGNGTLQFTAASTLNVTGDVNMDGTSQIYGYSTTVFPVLNAGTITVLSTATSCDLGVSAMGLTFTSSGAMTINGYLNIGTGLGSGTIAAPLRVVNSLYIGAAGTLATTAPVTQSILSVTNDFDHYGAITCTAAGTSPAYLVGGNFRTWPGSSIGVGGTSTTLGITITGTWTVESGGTTSVGWVDITANGPTVVDGEILYSGSSQGTKIFKNISISTTGIWNDAVGESVTINGNVVNSGSWDGCSGGTCTYTFGSVVGTYSVSGNPISVSILRVSAGTIVNNYGTISIDGSTTNILTGTGTFNNQNTGILVIQGGPGNNTTAVVNVTTFNATVAGNTVYYSQGQDQQIRIPSDGGYYNLDCSNGGTKTFPAASGGTIGITGTCLIEDATIFNVNQNTLNGAGGLTMTGTCQLQIAKCSGPSLPELTGTYNLTGGTIVLNGACAQTVNTSGSGGTTWAGITLGGSGIKTLTGITTINGDLTISGTASMGNTSAFTQDCSRSLILTTTGTTTLVNDISIGNFTQSTAGIFNDGGHTITVCGNTWRRTVAKANFVPTGSVIFNASAGTCTLSSSGVANITQFKNITISSTTTLTADANGMDVGLGGTAGWTCDGVFTHNSGTVTFVGNTSIVGTAVTTFNNFTINGAANVTGHATNIIVQGNWTNSGTFTHNNGTVSLTGGSAQAVTGNTTFYNFTVNKTTGTTATQAAATITVSNLFTMTNGIYATGTNALSGTAGFTATGGDLQMAAIATVPGLTGSTYSITGGTVTLNGAGAQTLRTSAATGGNTYYNLLFSVSGAKTITGLTAINGDATVSGSATLTSNSAFVQAAAKMFTYSSSGTTTLAAATAVAVGYFTISNGTLDINGNTFTVQGDWSKTGGTFTNAGASRVVFSSVAGAAQLFTDNGTTLTRVTVDNANGVTLNGNNMTISTDLTFTSGNITTGSNIVILNATAATVNGAAQGVGFVDGNFRKAIAAGASTRTFEIGTSGNYAPVVFTFSATCTAGNITATVINGDNPIIANSTLDPSATVNLNWLVTNNSMATIVYSAVFNYQAANVDPGYVSGNATLVKYVAPLWTGATMGTLNALNTQITAENTPASGTSEYFQIGNNYSARFFYNRVSGAGPYSWINKATWIKNLTGTISTSGVSTTVTGVGTLFTTELVVGDIIMLQTSPGTIYSVSAIANNTSLTISAATTIASGAYGVEAVPGPTDFVNIGNTNANTGTTVINMDDASTVVINRLQFNSMNQNHTLTHTTASTFSVLTTVTIQQPSLAAKLNIWDIAAGNAVVNGNVNIGNAVNTANEVAKITISTGTLDVKSNLLFQGGSAANAANAALVFSGAGTMLMEGILELDNGTAPYFGTLTPGASSIVNYNGTNLTQTINLNATAPAVTYANLYLNNTYSTGASLPANITAANVTGNLFVQTGIFNNAGFNITGNAAKTFSVASGTTFNMTATSTFPTGFGTFAFGATSNTYYKQTTNPITITNVASPGYGNLFLNPAGTATQRFSAATYNVQGNLSIGDATNITTVNASAATAVVNVLADVIINANATLNCSTNAMNMSVGDDWNNNGGTFTPGVSTVTFNGSGPQLITGTPASQTFYNFTVNQGVGGSLTVGGSTTSITTNTLTMTAGTFTAPATLNINSSASASSLVLTAGTFIAGATINITGNWTHTTGAVFTCGTGTVNFTGTTGQTINGTNTSETFYDVVESKTAGQLLTAGGSVATLNMHNFTETTGNFTAPATVSCNNLTLTAGTYVAGANTNVAGDVLFNGTTFTPGTNIFTFNGTTAQSLGGSGTIPTLYKLTLNNGTPTNQITLNKPLTMSNILTLTSGQLTTTSTNILTIAAGAPAPVLPGTANNSFVNGPMVHVKNTTPSEVFIFPVGKSNIAHEIDLTIGHSAVTSTNYTAEFFYSSAQSLGYTLPVTCSNVSKIDYWDINQSAGSSVTTASVKLYYTGMDSVNDPANLTVLKGDPSLWSDIGGPGSGSPSGNITSSINFTTFSKFAFGNLNAGVNNLPVKLLSFKALTDGNNVDVLWTTASEIDNKKFTVERSSDATTFSEIATVPSKALNGNSNIKLDYKVIDLRPLNGTSYYRLKQTDYNGKFEYFNVVSVNFDGGKNILFTVYPNPNEGHFTVDFSGIENNHEVQILMHDQNGNLVYSNSFYSQESTGSVSIVPKEKIAKGIYFCSLVVESVKYVVKIVVE